MRLLFFLAGGLAACGTARAQLDSALQWGTYRPNLYFGTRPRVPNSLLTGLMWFGLDSKHNWQHTRHSCELADGLDEYGYLRHNGRDFGEQVMRDTDHGVEITSQFVKVPGERGGSWAVRFTGSTLENNKQGVSLAYYFGLEGNGTMAMTAEDDVVRIEGETRELGRFKARIVPAGTNQGPKVPERLQKLGDISAIQKITGISLAVPGEDIWRAEDIFQAALIERGQAKINRIMELTQGKGPLSSGVIFGMDSETGSAQDNLAFAQLIVHGDFAFDVIYECADETAAINGEDIEAIASKRREEFDSRFEAAFGLGEKGFSDEEIGMAQRALSSLVGGIGYFYGSGLVSTSPMPEYDEGQAESDPQLTEPYSLFAIAPSRPFFPRGFLWDEGFQQLLLSQWDADMSLDIVRSWYGTMDENGWMAREQILGEEARSKVPEEFQVQYPNFANPPTLLLAVSALNERLESDTGGGMLNQLEHMYSEQGAATEQTLTPERMIELSQYVSRQLGFFMETQDGITPPGAHGHGYRWRGRTMDHTLPSGMDDYPRAQPPSSNELHVDLFAWVTFMLTVDARLEAYAGDVKNQTDSRMQQAEEHLKLLDELHWNEEEGMYCDTTLKLREDYDELEDEDSGDMYEPAFVCHRGYVSLLPMALGLVPPDSPKLGRILDMMEDPDQLWSDFGLRSLSKSDQFYGKGEDYWRGPVWLNINYLALSSLHRNYISVAGPHQEQAARIYRQLRQNIIDNVLTQFRETRFFWEQYNPEDGHGQGTHPFTGWTTLIVLIMAERWY
ncbi:Processing alpha glucosidase I [Coemansia sp. RSA 552]|nr:Processing alpha glucosidase I [Coemansia sp. RSA 552]